MKAQSMALNHCLGTWIIAEACCDEWIGQLCLVEAAVADFDGEMSLASSEAPATAHLSDDGEVVVRVIRLDSLVERGEIEPASVMKIDVECSEVKALERCGGTIEKYRPRILLATHNRELHTQCVEFLERRGYRIELVADLSLEGAELVRAALSGGVEFLRLM